MPSKSSSLYLEQTAPTWPLLTETQADPLPGPTTLASHTRGPRYSRSRSLRSNSSSNPNSTTSSRSVSRSRVDLDAVTEHVSVSVVDNETGLTGNGNGAEMDGDAGVQHMEVDGGDVASADENIASEDAIEEQAQYPHTHRNVVHQGRNTLPSDGAASRNLLTDLLQCRNTSTSDNTANIDPSSPIQPATGPGPSSQLTYTRTHRRNSSSSNKMNIESLLSSPLSQPIVLGFNSSGHPNSNTYHDMQNGGCLSATSSNVDPVANSTHSTRRSSGKRSAGSGTSTRVLRSSTRDSPRVTNQSWAGKKENEDSSGEPNNTMFGKVSGVEASHMSEAQHKGRSKGKGKEKEKEVETQVSTKDEHSGGSSKSKKRRIEYLESREEEEELWPRQDEHLNEYHGVDPSTIAGPSTLPYPIRSHSDASSRKHHDKRVKAESPFPINGELLPSSSLNIPTTPRNTQRQSDTNIIDISSSPIKTPVKVFDLMSSPTHDKTPSTISSNPSSSRTVQSQSGITSSQPVAEFCCPICFCAPRDATLTLCGHVFCGACLFAAVRAAPPPNVYRPTGVPPRCPVCRAPLVGWDGKGGGVIGLKMRTLIDIST